MKAKFYSPFLISFLLFFMEDIKAEAPNWEWVKGMGRVGFDSGKSIAKDSNGDIFLVGNFWDSVDFDPGLNTSMLTPQLSSAIFILKMDKFGNLIWAKKIDFPIGVVSGGLESSQVKTDANGNIFISGMYSGTVDFDPGLGSYNMTSHGTSNMFICKLANNGSFIWVKERFAISGDLDLRSMSIDKAGNVLFTGNFNATVIFNPDSNSSVLYSSGSPDYDNIFISKISADGAFMWVKRIASNDGGWGSTINVDNSGNVIVLGEFFGVVGSLVDFDPGTGIFNLEPSGTFILKLDSLGEFVWANKIYAFSDNDLVATDTLGNIYCAGTFYNTVDFDSGPGVFSMTSMGASDVYCSKLDINGNFVWAKKYGGPYIDWIQAIELDQFDNIYLAGCFLESTNLSPDTTEVTFISKGNIDSYVSKLSKYGDLIWAKQNGGDQNDITRSIAVVDSSNIYYTGDFRSSSISFDTFTLANSDTTTASDIFIAKLGCSTSSTINKTACNFFTAPSVNYIWTTSGTYIDTIPNTIGCDSIITINLTIINSSSSSQNIIACNSFTSPSGLFNWTAAGIYKDTIPNAVGCDSVITTNLTINNSSSASQTIAACHYFISPSGNHIWTSSGTYLDTIPNAVGCDSIITTILSIHDNESNITQSGCDSLVFNGQKYTSSGTYTQAFTNVAGCDSTLFLHLTLYQSSPQILQQSACDSMEWDGQVYYTSGTYILPHSNAAGCDSTVTLDLTITSSSSSSLFETACSNFTLNGIMYTSSGSYIQTLTNTVGCDSSITLQLTLNSTSSSITQTACDSIIVNGQKYTTSGVYTQTLTNAASCDSVLTLNLTINQGSTLNSSITACKSYFVNGNTYTTSGLYHLPFVNAGGCASLLHLNLNITQPDTSITQNSNVLSSNASGVTYQWLDCANGYQAIPGANAKNYTALANGSYAVALTKNSCSDTSACYTVLSIGIDGNSFSEKNISIYPNPSSNGVFMLDCGPSGTTHVALEIYNMLGAVVYTKNTFQIFKGKQILDLSALPSGSYFAAVKTGNEKKMIRLVIQ